MLKDWRLPLTAVIFTLLISGVAVAQQQMNLPLLSRWDDDSIPSAWTGSYSECGGYVDPSGREYAYIGSTRGIYFFNITDPVHPVQVGYFPTKDTVTLVVNKDFAVYQNYVYAVSDQGDNSLQIFDMQYLPDSVVKVYDSNALSKRCHTLFVDNHRLYMCSNTRPNTTFGPMDVFSLADPLQPQLMGTLSNPGFFSVHEAFVRNDTAWCANGPAGMWVYNMSNPAAPVLISFMDQYPEEGYNHSGWLTDDSRALIFTDENHGSGVKVFDVSDPVNPELKKIFRSNLLQVSNPLSDSGSVAHNPFVYRGKLFVAYYHDGVQVYDLSDPWSPERIGYYDTYPENTSYYSYAGCWGVYPFLPSGTIIASDIKNGLFLLDGSAVFAYEPGTPVEESGVQIAGNPFTEALNMLVALQTSGEVQFRLYDALGRLVLHQTTSLVAGRQQVSLPASGISKGIYALEVRGDGWKQTVKVFKGS